MKEQVLKELHEWGQRVSRLIELIALTNKTLQLHRKLSDSPMLIEQYERLLTVHQNELEDLLHRYGLTGKIRPI